jgi:uncharacterized protein (DUF58 family)
MKSCNPRSWPEQRFVVGVLLVALVAVAIVLMSRSILPGIAAGAALVVADFVAHRLQRVPGWRELDARLWTDGGGLSQVVVAGETITMHAKLSSARRMPGVVVAPLLPSSLRSLRHAGRILRGASGVVQMEWQIVPVTAGFAVIPGLLVIAVSPLGLFRSIAMAPARLGLFAVKTPEVVDALLPLLKRHMMVGEDRRRFVRGGGTDFRELRQYQPLDPLSRIDWKATARRSEVIVRDMEEPRELTISVVLDVSIDLMYGFDGGSAWFERTLLFLGSLADVCGRTGLRLVVTTYDDNMLHHMRLTGGTAGAERLLAELAELPRAAVLRLGERSRRQHGMLDRRALQRLRAWGVAEVDTEDFLARYGNGCQNSAKPLHALLADVEPMALLNLSQQCDRCASRVFPDERACPHCGTSIGKGTLPPRANSAAAAVAEALQAAHGRQVLVFVSALCGGEFAPEICQLLSLAQAQHRSVHIMAPSARELLSARPQWPGSLGHGPVRRDVLRDMDRLSRAADYTTFRRSLNSAGIAVHALDDSAQLHELIRTITTRELHVA